MDYRDEEYLKLFKQVSEQNIQTTNYSYEQLRNNNQMLKETPDYSNYNKPTNYNQNLNEVRRNNYSQDFNLNEFNIETRINGQNINEIKKQEKEDRLNEVMQKLREERLNEVKKNQEIEKLNEAVNFHDVDIVSVEMFNKARYNSMMLVANRILPR